MLYDILFYINVLFWLIRIVKGEQPASKAQTHLAFESPLEELAKLGKAQNQSYLLSPVNHPPPSKPLRKYLS